MLRFFRIYGMSIVTSLFILYLSIVPKMPDLSLPDFSLKDKVLHALAYLFLSVVLAFELYRQRYDFRGKVMFVWAIVYPILWGGLIELLQGNFFPPRSGDWGDWLSDIIGVLLGFFIAKVFVPRFFKPEGKGMSCR